MLLTFSDKKAKKFDDPEVSSLEAGKLISYSCL